MKRIFIHSLFFRILTPPIYGVLVYLIILLINNNVGQISTLATNQEMYVCMALSLISLESLRLAIILVDRITLPPRKKNFVQWMATPVMSVMMVLLAISQYYQWVIGFEISTGELWVFGSIFTFTAVMYNALYLGNQYLRIENFQRISQEQKLRENLEAEFNSFRQEINPDLLYDSLEELILCMHQKTETAEELIDSLASLYRYQLINRQKEFVTLSEELVAVHHLLRLASQKHNDQIRWTQNVPDTMGIQLMQGSLLTAIDSIVRNTLISPDAPLSLDLTQEEEDYLVLHHGLNDKLQQHPESLLAFHRLQRSYSIYCDRPFIQVKAGLENYIKFPLITVQQPATVPA